MGSDNRKATSETIIHNQTSGNTSEDRNEEMGKLEQGSDLSETKYMTRLHVETLIHKLIEELKTVENDHDTVGR